MKTIKFTGLFVAIMLLSLRMMAQTDQLVIPLSDPGKPFKLNVDMVFGSIKVVGYEGRDVVIESQTKERRRDDDDDSDHKRSGGMRRITANGGLDITAKERNNTVTVTTDMPIKATGITIKVPQNGGSFKLSSVNNSISVTNVSGDVEVNCTNGSATLNDISGSVVANSVNGTIRVNFNRIDAKAPMAFSTLNGSIDVTFPANLKANVKLKTDHGNIYSDFDIATDRRATSKASSSNGMYKLTVDETVYGKIDGGGPELLMKTMNGSIYIRKK